MHVGLIWLDIFTGRAEKLKHIDFASITMTFNAKLDCRFDRSNLFKNRAYKK